MPPPPPPALRTARVDALKADMGEQVALAMRDHTTMEEVCAAALHVAVASVCAGGYSEQEAKRMWAAAVEQIYEQSRAAKAAARYRIHFGNKDPT